MRVLAIDPGSTESAYVVIDTDTRRPVAFDKTDNETLRDNLYDLRIPGFDSGKSYIEQIGHYGTGMPAGKTVFDTCVWIGRFYEAIFTRSDYPPELVLRAKVKTHLCGQARAKDPNVVQALVDRFAPDATNHGKGTKANPGWFYGFRADIWQSYALAVYAADQLEVTAQQPPF